MSPSSTIRLIAAPEARLAASGRSEVRRRSSAYVGAQEIARP